MASAPPHPGRPRRRRVRRRLLALLALAWLALARGVPAAETASADPATRAFVAAALEEAGVGGASVVALRDGAVAWEDAFGRVDGPGRAPITPDSVFEAASLGKVVAAYGALLLVDAGTWSLDTPARSPRLAVAPGCDVPSLRQLLSHTAGLSNRLGAARFHSACRLPAPFAYAGQGYLVLQDMLAAETGMPAEAFLRERIFAPLGMEHSSFAAPQGDALAPGHADLLFALLSGRARQPVLYAALPALVALAAAAAWVRRRVRTPSRIRAAAAGLGAAAAALLVVAATASLVVVPLRPRAPAVRLPSSLYSSARDLGRFAQELLRPRLLRPATRDLLFSAPVAAGDHLGWGPGIGVDWNGGRTSYWQWGSNPGFQSLLVLEPAAGDAVVVLTDRASLLDSLTGWRGGHRAARRIARRVLGLDGRWDLHHRR